MTTGPTFPPLLRGEAVPQHSDPFAKAQSMALSGADPGLVCWSEDEAAMRAAITFAPEMPLQDAVGVSFAVAIGFCDSLGALAPPEVGVHFVWPNGFKVNGARCGHMRVAASTQDPEAEPDWLAVAIDVPILPAKDNEPGETPNETALIEEGCAGITSTALIESWSRHTLVWINRFLDDGFAPLHKDWCGRCDEIGEDIATPEPGTFVGLDEKGGMLLRDGAETRVIPLTRILESHA